MEAPTMATTTLHTRAATAIHPHPLGPPLATDADANGRGAPGTIQGWAITDFDSNLGPSGQAPVRLAEAASTRLVDLIAHGLAEIGVRQAFGIIGGAVAPMSDAIAQSPLRLVHCRHEAGAGFAATEASLASGRPCAVFCTTGPGFTNAVTGLFAGRHEGASIVLISAATPAALRGRGAFQETGPHNMPAGLYNPGGLFHLAATLEDAAQVDEVMVRLRHGLLRPGGFLAHLCVPTQNQTRAVARRRAPPSPASRVSAPPAVAAADVTRCVEELLAHRSALWVGFGARGASSAVIELAERLQLPVIATPRGKGVFPEDHPLYAGVTGFAGHDSVHAMLERHDPESLIVLGSRLGEFSSMWDERFVRPRGFLHVDLDPDAIGVAYPRAQTHGIRADIDAFVRAVLAELPASLPARAAPRSQGHRRPTPMTPRTSGPVRPLALMEAIQRVMVEGSDALILTEAGNAFAWGNHSLYFPGPGRYRVSMSWGSMGHAVAGVLGAGMCRGAKAVAVAGDGAMLMNNELSTAVQYRVPAVWIILNDSQYGLIEHGMRSLGYVPERTEIPRVDFVAIARAVGADGVRVSREDELDGALAQAMAASGPFVVDVLIDPREPPPVGSRVERLREQGVDGAWSKEGDR
ncbi:MAG: thiamine pyrophosphate-dependent enzyme [Nannocystaceae bacterium]